MHWCSTSKEQCNRLCHLQQIGVERTEVTGDHCGQLFHRQASLSLNFEVVALRKAAGGITHAKKPLHYAALQIQQQNNRVFLK